MKIDEMESYNSPTASAFNFIPSHMATVTSMLDYNANNTIADLDRYDPHLIHILTLTYPRWPILLTEECTRLREDNRTLWNLLEYHTNLTTGSAVKCFDHAPVLDLSKITQAAILGVMCILSLIGNVLTVYSLTHKQKSSCRQYSSSVYYLILHLSIADLLVTITCLLGEATWSLTVSWLADDLTCKFFKFVQMFSLYLSTFVLVLIGLDRFLAVKYPMKSLSNKKRCNRLLTGVWVLSIIFSCPQFLIFRVMKGPFYEDFSQCVTYGFYTELWQEQLYTISSLFVMFILPLSIIVWSYVSTFITLAKSEKMFRAEVASGLYLPQDINRRRLMNRAKTKSMRISVVIVVAFIICWTPYYFMMVVFMFLDPGETIANGLMQGIFFFGMSNSLVNPVIYGAFHLWKPNHHRKLSTSKDFQHMSMRSASQRRPVMNGPKTEATHIHEIIQEDTSLIVSMQEETQQQSKLKSSKLTAKILLKYKGVFSPQPQIHL